MSSSSICFSTWHLEGQKPTHQLTLDNVWRICNSLAFVSNMLTSLCMHTKSLCATKYGVICICLVVCVTDYDVGGLHEHFKKPQDCVIKYMIDFKDQEKCIFQNYTLLFLHVFKGLQYLHSKGIVHGDIKGVCM